MRRLSTALSVFLIAGAPTSSDSAVPTTLTDNDRIEALRRGEHFIDLWDPAPAAEIAMRLTLNGRKDAEATRLAALAAFYQGRYSDAERYAQEASGAGALEPDLQSVIETTHRITKGWKQAEGPHFVVSFAAGPDEVMAKYALDALERTRAAFKTDLGWASDEKVRVEIYPSSEAFIQVSTLSREEVQTTGTIALCKFNRLMITTPRALVYGYPWLDTLAHEYAHFAIVKASDNNVPIWLHEGIAKFEETRWRTTEGGQLEPSITSVLAEAIARDHFIAFERMHPSIAKLPSAWEAQLAFAEVVSAIGFIKKKAGATALPRLLSEMKGGATPQEAVARVTGIAWSDFDSAWKQYLKAQNYKQIPGLAVLPIALKAGAKNEAEDASAYHGLNDATRRFMRLGDLLRNHGRLTGAAAEYRKALKSQGQYAPMIGHKIAFVLLKLGRLKEATEEFERVLAMYPDFAPSLASVAEVYQRASQWSSAREYAWRAVTVNPFDPASHDTLLSACEHTQDKQCTEAEKRALQILMGERQR